MNKELRREVERWHRYATEDLQAAQWMIDQGEFFPRHPAFLAQQAAEKAIKSILVLLQIEFPFTHDLEELIEFVPETWRVTQIESNLKGLSEMGVEPRYPGDLPDISIPQAIGFVEDATRIVEAIETDLNQRLRDT